MGPGSMINFWLSLVAQTQPVIERDPRTGSIKDWPSFDLETHLIMITLLTDFGNVDPYVAQMKAVIYSSAPGANVVDISHGIEKHNIAMGSYVLEASAPWFPAGSIHVAVVDPGVGSTRLPIVIESERGVLVGPDNGLLARTGDLLGFKAAYRIEKGPFRRDSVSSTFHARDIFAQTAAVISQGRKPSEVGRSLRQLVRLDRQVVDVSKEPVACQVLYVDSFGNVVIDIVKDQIDNLMPRMKRIVRLVSRRKNHTCMFVEAYSEIPRGENGLLLGSQGYLELARREESAAGELGLRPGDNLKLYLR